MLNNQKVGSKYRAIAATPEVLKIQLWDKWLWFDCNTLALSEEPVEGEPRAYQAPLLGFHTPVHIVLNVTHDCNLGCEYCFASEHLPQDAMSVETAYSIFKHHCSPERPLAVSFFGGEPLVAWDRVLEIMHLAEDFNSNARFHITTNGTLLSDEICEELRTRNCSLILSLDGPKDIHNRHRVFKNGDGSFDSAIRGLRLLKKYGLWKRTTLRATFTPECTRVGERLEFLYGLQKSRFCGGFSIEPASLSEGCMVGDGEYKGLVGEYHGVSEMLLGLLSSGEAPGFFHYRKMCGRLYARQISVSECGAGRGYVTFGPNGDVYACHRETGTLIGKEGEIDEVLRQPWCENRYYGTEKCRGCWARNLCGGGCRQGRSQIHKPRDFECYFKQMLIRECMWLLSETSENDMRRWLSARK